MKKRKKYSKEFKQDAVRLVTEQGYAIAEAARNLGLNAGMLGRWKMEAAESEGAFRGNGQGVADVQLASLEVDVAPAESRDLLAKSSRIGGRIFFQ